MGTEGRLVFFFRMPLLWLFCPYCPGSPRSPRSLSHTQGTGWFWAAGMELATLTAGAQSRGIAFNPDSRGWAYRPKAVLEIFRLGLQGKKEGETVIERRL